MYIDSKMDNQTKTNKMKTLHKNYWIKKNNPKTKPLPLFMTFNLRYSLHKQTDELNRSVPFLHTDNARFVLSVSSKTPTCRDEKT